MEDPNIDFDLDNLFPFEGGDQELQLPYLGLDDASVSEFSMSLTKDGRDGSGERSSKKRKCNPDAAAIAEVTEQSMKALNISDMESKEAKKVRRQIRNRLSAQFHRNRKNQYISTLEQEVAVHKQQILLLQAEVSRLVTENQALNMRLSVYESNRSQSEALTDSEQGSSSSFSSPSDSPLHLSSGDESSVSSTRIQSMPSFGLPKAVVYMAMVCMACICCLQHLPLPLSLSPSPPTRSSISTPLSSSDLSIAPVISHYGRRLTALEIKEEDSPLSVNITRCSNTNSPRQYLRHHPVNYTANTTQVDHESYRVRKDLVPFELPPGYLPPTPPQHKTFSHIIMQHGVALFDPTLQLPNTFAWPEKEHSKAVVQTAPYFPALHTPLLPTPSAADSTPQDDKHWPVPVQENCEEAKQSVVKSLLSRSHIVTVTLPASAIKLGNTLDESTEGTMEGIQRMFNITLPAGSENTTTLQSTAEALVEINCIILNAKLMVRST